MRLGIFENQIETRLPLAVGRGGESYDLFFHILKDASRILSPDMRQIQGLTGTLPRHANLPKDALTPTDRHYLNLINSNHTNHKGGKMTKPSEWPSVWKARYAEPQKALQAFQNP